MKALSLWQPWGSAMAAGLKKIETRSWATNYTGPIAIHAAKKWDAELRHYTAARMNEMPMAWSAIGINYIGEMPLSAIIATATLECCRRTEDLIGKIDPIEQSWGDFSPNRYGWMFADIKRLEEPIPARGYQQLWEWETIDEEGEEAYREHTAPYA